jgi:hypothetical protein
MPSCTKTNLLLNSLDNVLVLLVFPLRVLPPPVHDGGVDVGRTVRVGLVQKTHHRQQDRPEKIIIEAQLQEKRKKIQSKINASKVINM